MSTLIIPCGGRSSRFPNMKPKWMLTHPDGNIMVRKAIEGIDISIFDRFIITIIDEHDKKYDASLVLRQAFDYLNQLKGYPKLELCILNSFTKSASETIVQTLIKMNVEGSFVVKDSDNKIAFKNLSENYIVGCEIEDFPINNLQGKSYLHVNDSDTIYGIVEKKIVSSTICLGAYCFLDPQQFIKSYNTLLQKYSDKEMYISAVVQDLISKGISFRYVKAENYSDWGTLIEWKKEQKNHITIFTDFDGVLIQNSGKYGKLNWDNNDKMLEKNCERLRKLQNNGAQIIVTTARPEKYKEKIKELLTKQGIFPYAILTGLNHAQRVLINDFAPTNPYPSALAINIKRNSDLQDYI